MSFPDGTTDAQIIDYVTAQYGPKPPAPPPEEPVGALESGFYGSLGSLEAAGGKAAQAVGLEGLSNYLFEQSRASQEYAAKYQPEVADISQIEGVGDVASFAGSTIAQSLPETAVGVGGAYAGAVAGGSIGAAVGAPFFGIGAAPAAAAGATIGGIIGGAMASLPFFVGSNLQRQAEEKNIPLEETSGYNATVGAIAQAPLDAAFETLVARKFPGAGAALDVVKQGFFKEVARTAGQGAVTEALTEPAQQAIEIAQANPEKLLDFGPEVQQELLNAAAAGALAGGAIGGGAGAIGSIASPAAPDPNIEARRELGADLQAARAKGDEIKRFGEISLGVQKLAAQPTIGRLKLDKIKIDPTPENKLKTPLERFRLTDFKGTPIAEFTDPALAVDAVNRYQKIAGKKITLQNTVTGSEIPTPQISVPSIKEAPPAPQAPTQPKIGEAVPEAPLPLLEAPKPRPSTGEGQRPAKLFKTALGSQYTLFPDGGTARIKTPHPGHDPKDVGPKPKSEKTFFIRPEDQKNLDIMTAQGLPGTPIIAEYKPGVIGVKYTSGPEAGKFIRGTVTKSFDAPEVGLRPVEIWNGGRGFHFGNNIIEVNDPPVIEPSAIPPAAPAADIAPGSTREATALGPSDIEAVSAEDQIAARQRLDERVQKVSEGVRNALAKYGLKDVQTKFVPAFADGLKVSATRGTETVIGGKSIINLATGIYDPDLPIEDLVNRVMGTLNHESIHSLVSLGLLRENEMQLLFAAAENTKVPGKKYTYLDYAKSVYGPMARTNPAYSNPESIKEEAVAEMFRDWREKKLGPPPQVRGLINRIIEAVRSMFNSMRRENYATIFAEIEKGVVGQRNRSGKAQRKGVKASIEVDSTKSDAFKKWFSGSKVVDANGNPLIVYHGTDAKDFSIFKTPSFFTEDPKEAGAYSFVSQMKKRESVLAKGKYRIIKGSGGVNITKVPYYGTINDIEPQDFGKVVLTDNGVARKNKDESIDLFEGWVVDDYLPEYMASIKRGDGSSVREIVDEYNKTIDRAYPPSVGVGGRVYPVYLSIKNPIEMDALKANRLGARLNSMSSKEIEDFIRDLESRGYDGIATYSDEGTLFSEARMDGRVQRQFIPFKASQIKSVMNTGTFDPNNPDIRYSIEPELPTLSHSPNYPYEQRVPEINAAQINGVIENLEYGAAITLMERVTNSKTFKAIVPERFRPSRERYISLVQNFADKMLPLGLMVDYIKKNGGTVPDALDAFMQEDLMRSKVGNMLDDREQNLYGDLIKYLRDNNVSMAEFEDYLYARHAKERNERIREINPGADETVGSGMSDEEADAILAAVESSPQQADFIEAERLFRAIIDDTNSLRVEAGLTPDFDQMVIEDEAGNLVRAKQYKFYAPLRGFSDESSTEGEVTEEIRARIGQGFKIRGREDMRAFGRRSKASDIIAHAILQNSEALIRAEKNKVGLSLLGLVEANPELAADFGVEVMTKGKKPLKKYVSSKGVVKTMVDPMYKNSDDVMVVKREGQEIPIRINNRFLQKALLSKKSASPDLAEKALSFMQMGNRFLASVNTAWNPEFMLINFPRDLQTALINISQYEIDGIKTKVLKDSFKAIRGVHQVLRDPKAENDWSDWYKMFREDGGNTNGFFGAFTLEDRINRMTDLVNEKDGSVANKTKKAVFFVRDMLENANGAFENAIRLSVYKNVIEAGVPRQRAAQIAKNLTVNFDKRGEYGPVLNSLYLFYNASVQGTLAMAMAAGRSKKVRRAFAGLIVMGMMQDIINSLISDEDEDGTKIYDKIPDYKLEANIILMDPYGITENGYFAIPLPYGFNAFFNMGRALSRNVRGEYKTSEALTSMGATFLDAFNPVGGTESLLNFIAPTALDPLVALSINQDFTGRRIYPEPFPGSVPKADSQQYWSSTSPIFRNVTDFMNTVTGGTEYVPGMIDWNPAVMEYIYDYALGGLGGFMRRTYDTATQTIPAALTGDLENIEVNTVPVFRKLYGNVSERVTFEDYFNKVNHVLARGEELKSAIKEGDPERIRSVRARFSEELKIYPAVRALANKRNQLAAELRKVRENEKMPPEAKRRRQDALQKQIEKITDRVNKLYEDNIDTGYPSLFS